MYNLHLADFLITKGVFLMSLCGYRIPPSWDFPNAKGTSPQTVPATVPMSDTPQSPHFAAWVGTEGRLGIRPELYVLASLSTLAQGSCEVSQPEAVKPLPGGRHTQSSDSCVLTPAPPVDGCEWDTPLTHPVRNGACRSCGMDHTMVSSWSEWGD